MIYFPVNMVLSENSENSVAQLLLKNDNVSVSSTDKRQTANNSCCCSTEAEISTNYDR